MKARKKLTKSIFKVGLECPKKLFYLGKPDEYFNKNEEDPFLQALAKGGYQVGALAQLKYPQGQEITTRNHDEAIKQTAEYFAKQDGALFEAAFGDGAYFVRTDIALKYGDNLRIIEVKSKSFDPTDPDFGFLTKKSKPGAPKLTSEWDTYIYDIAYQVWVARKMYPNLKVSASFMGVDKTATCETEQLHQMFMIQQDGPGSRVILTRQPEAGFKGHSILREVDITDLVNDIIDGREQSEFFVAGNMQHKAEFIAELYLNNKTCPTTPLISNACKTCEFKGSAENLKSGFDECWVEGTNVIAASSKKLPFDVWNFRGSDKAFAAGKYLLEDLDEEDLGSGKNTFRQLIQIEKHKANDKTPWFDHAGLKAEMESWTYPLHFIDFETCTPAIPFFKGFAPYSELAFQFSHHTMDKDGTVKHVGQYINLEPGVFPTFEFVRELKKQLQNDEGTIFRYSAHENSVLSRAKFLLERSNEPDREELIEFIKTITAKKVEKSKTDEYVWKGARNMIDLCELTKQYYYSPPTGGSNSLKYVLPAILNESSFLREKYSNPIYGSAAMPSLNFKNHTWLNKAAEKQDPYKSLPEVFTQEEMAKIESMLSDDDAIRNGGAAMMAYSKCQYTQMSAEERAGIRQALLNYCELDTLAMVMLVEYWLDVVGGAMKQRKSA